MKEEIVWVQFACAIVAGGKVASPSDIGKIADMLLGQWSIRYGDAAFLLSGQSECAACHKDLESGEDFTASTDGVKFCSKACLIGSGREE